MRRNNWLGSTLIGSQVRNSNGEPLGKVEELVVDPFTGNISFAILSIGGFLGTGDTLMAVPWAALRVLPGRNYVLLDADKQVLQKAPQFERTNWPDTSDAAWKSRIYSHYGQPDPAVVRKPRKKMSVLSAGFLVLLLAGMAVGAYMVETQGWEQTRNDFMNSMQGVTYAMKETSSDAALTAKIKTAFTLNKRIPAGDIKVDSADGIVTLRGDVDREEIRALAEVVARDTPGAIEVHNHIYVIPPGHN
jgi:sporulation protein YlmC with PRC-barrel domain